VTTLARTAPAGPPAYAIDSPAHPTLADLWTAELGRSWRLVLGALLALVALAGVAAPLADPDLPIHLATGEWIARHGALPFVEPFAWTRAGEPFYAYSWAIELAYFALWRAFGVAGLHLLHGVLLALAVASVLILGRVAGWRPWSVVLVSLAQLDIAIRVAAFLRPQLLLLILLPLVWALALLVWRAPSLRTPAARWSLLGLAVIGCVASNTHLLFPLTAVPCGLVALTAPRLRAGRAAALLGALALGWTVSPYTLVWPQMFAQNLGGNLRLQFPSAIGEYMPGFSTLWDGTGIVTAAILVALPWLLPASGDDAARGAVTARERAWFGVAWSVGLVAFATASRALLVWWVAVLPLVGRAADQLPSATPSTRRLRTLLAFGFVGVLALKPLAVVVRQVCPRTSARSTAVRSSPTRSRGPRSTSTRTGRADRSVCTAAPTSRSCHWRSRWPRCSTRRAAGAGSVRRGPAAAGRSPRGSGLVRRGSRAWRAAARASAARRPPLDRRARAAARPGRGRAGYRGRGAARRVHRRLGEEVLRARRALLVDAAHRPVVVAHGAGTRRRQRRRSAALPHARRGMGTHGGRR
jgi:hypothetical protein